MPKFTHKKKSKNNVKPSWEHYLEQSYFDPSHLGNFRGAYKLHEAIKDEGKYTISLSKYGYKIKNHSVFTNHYADLFTISKLSSED